MQNVATRVDQSCRRCARGEHCIYATWSAAYIWLEVEQGLYEIRWCDLREDKPGPPCRTCEQRQRRILNLMSHYGQRVYFESEESC